MAVKPITGMLRRGLVLDLSVALGLGVSSAYFFWYGYHVPAVRKRDNYYAKLENERSKALGQV
ncbi:cytochrome c oxidase family protein-like protein [Viridothelium virens]|uniref:Cytochrome c oxidase subunit 9, mitochondrial n=1 Tax=Viridothelium virens TaxID=1048519 RepID=A0A6A6HII9_VIRVR|nr:cytochrome c oxidase family protein-like protein [Viridothelium virens]